MYSPDTGYPCDPGDTSCTGGPVGIWGPTGTSDPDRICRINLSCATSSHVRGEGIYGRSSVSRSYYGQAPLSNPSHKIAWHRLANIAHAGLSVIGLIPIFGNAADLTDAALYGAQGDPRNAAISSASALPGIGLLAGGWRVLKRIRTAAKASRSAKSGKKLLWTLWQKYPKVTRNGREYAKIGDRLYSHHAVDRMQPSGLGAPTGAEDPGRSVSPNYIEHVIDTTKGVPTKGSNRDPRMSHTSGTVQVTISEHGIVVTVMTR